MVVFAVSYSCSSYITKSILKMVQEHTTKPPKSQTWNDLKETKHLKYKTKPKTLMISSLLYFNYQIYECGGIYAKILNNNKKHFNYKTF